MTPEQRATFDRDGYLIIRGALAPDEVTAARDALDWVNASAAKAGGDHAWGHDPATTPLDGWLKERGFLNPANPPLRP
jgi:Phytanoyl-CoA dioxygenase (PhyH)